MAGQASKGGGQALPVMSQASTAQPFNVNTAASTGLQNAMAGTQTAMASPLNVGAYMNPYTTNVINRTQDDIERQRQMASNNLAAQANAANAFGGSRHGVAAGTMAGDYGRMGADIAAQQRQAGYGQSLNAAMADRNARAGFANQLRGLAGQAFNTGRAINQDMMTQGLMQQGLQQALIDAARSDFSNYTGSPMASLSAPLAALGASPNPTTTTSTSNPGILGTLGALKYIAGPAAGIPFF